MSNNNVVGVGVGLIMALLHSMQGCRPVYTSQDQMDQDYKAELKACVESAKTKPEAEVCMKGVRWKYNVCEAPSGEMVPCQPL